MLDEHFRGKSGKCTYRKKQAGKYGVGDGGGGGNDGVIKILRQSFWPVGHLTFT